MGGGASAGGTLVSSTGRGVARAGARPSSAQNRFGTLWHHRNASISARCRFLPLEGDAPDLPPSPEYSQADYRGVHGLEVLSLDEYDALDHAVDLLARRSA